MLMYINNVSEVFIVLFFYHGIKLGIENCGISLVLASTPPDLGFPHLKNPILTPGHALLETPSSNILLTSELGGLCLAISFLHHHFKHVFKWVQHPECLRGRYRLSFCKKMLVAVIGELTRTLKVDRFYLLNVLVDFKKHNLMCLPLLGPHPFSNVSSILISTTRL